MPGGVNNQAICQRGDGKFLIVSCLMCICVHLFSMHKAAFAKSANQEIRGVAFYICKVVLKYFDRILSTVYPIKSVQCRLAQPKLIIKTQSIVLKIWEIEVCLMVQKIQCFVARMQHSIVLQFLQNFRNPHHGHRFGLIRDGFKWEIITFISYINTLWMYVCFTLEFMLH